MTRQVQNRQGRIINPLHTILFVSALLVFIFTVIYRMVKSASFSSAMATLVESLLIVSFFIFLGILLAYIFYFVYEKIRQAARQRRGMFVDPSARNESAGKPDPNRMGLKPDDEVASRPNS
jgi:predicted PurR-regulated permease PerM